MKGMTQVRVGLYDLADHLKLCVQASDAGTVLTVLLRGGRRHQATIDEYGKITIDRPQERAASSAITFGLMEHDPLETPPEEEEEEVLPPSISWKPKKGEKRIKFTLQYGPTAMPRNRPYVIDGFSTGEDTHVLYIITSGSAPASEGQLLLTKDGRATGRGIVPAERMSKESRAWFLTLDDGAEFGLGSRDWRKMAYCDLRTLLEEKTIKLSR